MAKYWVTVLLPDRLRDQATHLFVGNLGDDLRSGAVIGAQFQPHEHIQLCCNEHTVEVFRDLVARYDEKIKGDLTET